MLCIRGVLNCNSSLLSTNNSYYKSVGYCSLCISVQTPDIENQVFVLGFVIFRILELQLEEYSEGTQAT